VTLRYRELEHTRLYAGLGVRLIDDYTQQGPIGGTRVLLDADDDGVWRELAPDQVRRTMTAGGVVWFPWLERHRDARGRAPGRYRVRVVAELGVPAYLFDSEGVVVLVAPFDDAVPPAGVPPIIDIALLPSAGYPFGPGVPVLRGAVRDAAGAPLPRALVSWADPQPGSGPPLVTDEVLSDDDGEFGLPMRRAPRGTPIDVTARRPPDGGSHITVSVRIPDDISTFLTMQIL